MEIINAIILGIIQGLTEFLPVSSSGHLEIAKKILGQEIVGEKSLLMTVVLHFATALATILVFKDEVFSIIKGLLLFDFKNEEFKFSLKIILSMVPAVFIGLIFDNEVKQLFSSGIFYIGIMLMITGVLLLFADKSKTSNKNINYRDALLIGFSQAIAIIPGISRSGATISTSVLLGIDKEASARFSFLMVVPLIFGKILQDFFSGNIIYEDTIFTNLLVGFFAALITGFFACKLMISIVKKSKLKYFSIYCFIVGLLTLVYSN